MEIIIKCSDDVRGGTNIYGEPIQELVRCEDCYMCDEEMWCSFYDSIMESDDFCSYGERKESE